MTQSPLLRAVNNRADKVLATLRVFQRPRNAENAPPPECQCACAVDIPRGFAAPSLGSYMDLNINQSSATKFENLARFGGQLPLQLEISWLALRSHNKIHALLVSSGVGPLRKITWRGEFMALECMITWAVTAPPHLVATVLGLLHLSVIG